MKILITGASGFIGRYAVREALARDHEVIALSRRQPDNIAAPSLRWMRHDLAAVEPPRLDGLGIDAVVHLAAALTGPVDEQYSATVLATRQLLTAMRQAGIRRLIGISSIAVLDYPALAAMALIDEATPRAAGTRMGTYARMKLEQELLFEEFLAGQGACGAILRPGLVYDTQVLFSAHAGIFKGPLRLCVSHGGEVPVIAAVSLARAILDAAALELDREILQLVDDNLPDLAQYRRALQQRGALPAGAIALPWRGLASLASLARSALGAAGQANSLPEALLAHGFAARLKPFRYANHRAKQRLGWTPGKSFA